MVSRVAKSPVDVPNGVEVSISPEQIQIKGKHGSLSQAGHALVDVAFAEGQITVAANQESIQAHALSGTYRALIQNMVIGTSEGFVRSLKMVGVGYRAKADGNSINISAGFSHPVDMKMPAGVTVETPNPTEILVKGADKQQVGQVAANIRAVRPPEPYKGKGIRYTDEHVSLKEVKKK